MDARPARTDAPARCPVTGAADFEPFGPAYNAEAGASLAGARAERPVFHHPGLDYWIVTRYRDVRAVFGDPDTFSAANAMDPYRPLSRPALRELVRRRFTGGPVLANEDEPVHLRRRRRLARPFTRRRVQRLEPRVRALVGERIDAFAGRGHADLVAELLWEVPALVVAVFMGVPDEDLAEVRGYSVSQAVFNWGLPTDDEQVAACDVMGRYWQYAAHLVSGLKEAEGRGAGWIAHAVRAQARNPELFSDSYLQSLVLNGTTAAHETTASGAANAVRTLLETPGAWAALCADPAGIPAAVEECLRLRPPVVAWRRRVVRDTVLGGVPLAAGARLLLVTASANRDAEMFADPDTFDPARRGVRRHLAFGDGNHACLGAHLARLQLRVVLEELTRRLPALELVPGQDFGHAPNTSFHGPERLLVRWPAS
ncbi:cytochrome P450 [Micromonospora aurantiaca]|uniref:cytochrome P450 n=1 Tax=Micromonospora aurantiaca (nom. illeg.) TaxID=47850 RepID=UPI0037FD4F35